MNKTKQYIFDTNYYRTILYDKTRIETKSFLDSQKNKEREKGIKILFPNIVAIELINHLNENNKTAKMCFEALFGLTYHTGKFENNKVTGTVVSTFHCIMSNYLFNSKSNYFELNNGILFSSFNISRFEKFEESINKNKDRIEKIIKYKKDELNFIIKSIEKDYLSKYSNDKKNIWNIVKDDKFKKAFIKDFENKKFHNLIARSLIKMGTTLVNKKSIKDISKEKLNRFIYDFSVSIDFYIIYIWKKMIEIKTEYFIKPDLDKKLKRWNSFYDMQLIMATEYHNSLGKETTLVTGEKKIIEHFEKFNKKNYAMSIDEYNKMINYC